jgi:glycosyltransferase domain-containing protein
VEPGVTTDGDLTILLALKDRTAFTARWMAFADSVRLPFRVLIADGGTDDSAAALLTAPGAFPHVNYEYVRYPPDRHYAIDYWAKLGDILPRVRTPFVALADNDDLFIVNGVKEAVGFLADHPDYAACGGQCAVFWVTGNRDNGAGVCYGPHVQWKCTRDRRSLDHDTAGERLRHHPRRATHAGYYHVRRTEQFRAHVAAVREARLHDVFLIERLLLWLTAITGKVRQLDTLYLARQWNAPDSAGGAEEATYGDWFGRMLVPTWSADFERFLAVTSAALASRDEISTEEARQVVLEVYRRFVAPNLLGDLARMPTVTLPMSLVARAVRRLLGRPSESALRRLMRALYRRTPWIAADAVFGTELRARHVPNADGALRPIRDFLATAARPAVDDRPYRVPAAPREQA